MPLLSQTIPLAAASRRARETSCAGSLGCADQALARAEEALSVARASGYPLALAVAISGAAVACWLRGNAEVSPEQAETLLTLARENGFPTLEALALGHRGWALAMLNLVRART